MYINIGGQTLVDARKIMYILNAGTGLSNASTRHSIEELKSRCECVMIYEDVYKSIVLVCPGGGERDKLYFSPVSTATLFKRIRRGEALTIDKEAK